MKPNFHLNKKKNSILLSFIFLLLLTNVNFLLSQQFNAYVNPNPVPEGELFQVTYVLKAEGNKFEPPKFKNFTLVNGPSTSSEYSFINGRTSRQTKYTYTLRADKKGEFNIEPATVVVDGKTIQSNTTKLSVIEPSQALKDRRKQEAETNKSLNQQANEIISKNLFAKATINKNSAYIGEQLIATYKIYINEQLNLVDLAMTKTPSFVGFWTQSFDEKQLNYDREIINGVPFKVAVVKQVLLFPQQSGNLTLDEMDFKSKVRLRTSGGNGGNRRRSIFDDFFNDSYQDFDYTVSTTPIRVNVKALPNNAPISFNGGVGDYKLEAWLDKTETVTNEPITLKIKISGTGNLKLVQPINLNLPPGFESYEPKTIDNVNVNLSGMNGNLMFEYLLIPRNQGTFTISPIEFSFFNLESKQYITLNSDEFKLKVGKGEGGESYTNLNGVKKEDAEYLGQDIRYIKTKTNINTSNFFLFNSIYHYLMLLSSFGLFLGLVYYKNQNIKLAGNTILLKNKQATKIAQKRLKLANNYLKENKLDLFYEELSKALWGYVSDKLSIPTSDLTKDVIKEKLSKLNIPSDSIQMLIVTIDDCEFARYAASALNKEPKDLYLYAQTVITEIEETLK